MNGYPYFAEVIDFVNKDPTNEQKGDQKFDFQYRIKNKENYDQYLKNSDDYDPDLFFFLYHNPKENVTKLMPTKYMRDSKEVIIKNFNKVGVMSLEDSELILIDEKRCTLKRKGSNCKMESMVEFSKLASGYHRFLYRLTKEEKGIKKIIFSRLLYDNDDNVLEIYMRHQKIHQKNDLLSNILIMKILKKSE